MSILDNLKANSNIVDISNNQYAVKGSRNYYRGVVELEKHNLIRLTNKNILLLLIIMIFFLVILIDFVNFIMIFMVTWKFLLMVVVV